MCELCCAACHARPAGPLPAARTRRPAWKLSNYSTAQVAAHTDSGCALRKECLTTRAADVLEDSRVLTFRRPTSLTNSKEINASSATALHELTTERFRLQPPYTERWSIPVRAKRTASMEIDLFDVLYLYI
eukprot:6201945-Pleurochrysis_carterae.AAC.2